MVAVLLGIVCAPQYFVTESSMARATASYEICWPLPDMIENSIPSTN